MLRRKLAQNTFPRPAPSQALWPREWLRLSRHPLANPFEAPKELPPLLPPKLSPEQREKREKRLRQKLEVFRSRQASWQIRSAQREHRLKRRELLLQQRQLRVKKLEAEAMTSLRRALRPFARRAASSNSRRIASSSKKKKDSSKTEEYRVTPRYMSNQLKEVFRRLHGAQKRLTREREAIARS
jgi:hypothetical protein